MGLVKRTYVDQETVITAENLNAIQDAIIENEEAIEDQGETIEGKYAKPSGGIPKTDLASSVQESLDAADTAYHKPSGGIPKTDLASAVQTSLGKADTALQSSDIDNTLSVTGKAADAKKTGDEISGIKNTLTQLDGTKAAKVDLVGNIILNGTNTTGADITAGTYFYNNGVLKRAIATISGSPAGSVTDQNSETVTAGGLNDLMDSLTPTYTQYKYSAESDTSVAANGISAEIPVSVNGTKGEVIGVVGVAPGNTLMGVVGFRKTGNTINVVVWNSTSSPRNCRPEVHVIQVLYPS